MRLLLKLAKDSLTQCLFNKQYLINQEKDSVQQQLIYRNIFLKQKIKQVIFDNKTDQINLQYGSHIQGDKLTIQVCYRQNKNFIGPIQFYKKGSGDFDQDQFIDLQIQGDNTKFPFWRKWFMGGDDDNNETKVSKILDNDDQKDKNRFQKDSTKFYKGAHKNRNIFSLCDQVYDDQKFTVVQNYYNHQ